MSRMDDDTIATSDVFPFSIPKGFLHSKEMNEIKGLFGISFRVFGKRVFG